MPRGIVGDIGNYRNLMSALDQSDGKIVNTITFRPEVMCDD